MNAYSINQAHPSRLIVGISGASGVLLGYELLKTLREQVDAELHLVVSDGAKRNFELETSLKLEDVYALADHVHDDHNLAAVISSGSFVTSGMIVAPCSMKTLSGIANGYSDNLLVRAADVCLKEGRRVVLVSTSVICSQLLMPGVPSFHRC